MHPPYQPLYSMPAASYPSTFFQISHNFVFVGRIFVFAINAMPPAEPNLYGLLRYLGNLIQIYFYNLAYT